MGWHIKNNVLRVVRILDVEPENPRVKTIFFEDELCSMAEPGQFIMVWIPGIDEVPISISSVYRDGTSSITVAEVGEATKALTNMKAGDLIGVRGPFGKGFKIAGGRALIVGGGTGMAPLMLLIDKLIEEGIKTTVIEGAESIGKMLFLKRLRDLSESGKIKVFFTTEDGSYGFRGVATDVAERILSSEKIDSVYSCGPEKMLVKIYNIAKAYSVNLQVSLERYMRCAVGICGSCVIGRYRVCKDGPVFDVKMLEEVESYLGVFKYNERGEKVPII